MRRPQRGGRMFAAAIACMALSGCSMFKIVVPGQPASSACAIALRDLPQTERDAVAAELGALDARDAAAVTPVWIKDYLKLRATVRAACAGAG